MTLGSASTWLKEQLGKSCTTGVPPIQHRLFVPQITPISFGLNIKILNLKPKQCSVSICLANNNSSFEFHMFADDTNIAESY